jgi:carbon-monoxide dehydrogenase large subunit
MPLRENAKAFFCPDPLPDGPWGAKGIGEGTMIAVAPAIANAIWNAVGTRFKDLPLSAERILRGIQENQTTKTPQQPTEGAKPRALR